MTFERSTGPPMEAAPTPGPTPTPVQIRLQILTTEHWSLLASRSLAWNEAFTRAGMYLSTLSGSMVALGLIGGIDGFGGAFLIRGAYLEIAPDLEPYFVLGVHDDPAGIGITMAVPPERR
jgi:hypothetical protein